MFRVYRKAQFDTEFYSEKEEKYLTEILVEDSDDTQIVIDRNGRVIIIEHICYDQYSFHYIENNNDKLYRVEF